MVYTRKVTGSSPGGVSTFLHLRGVNRSSKMTVHGLKCRKIQNKDKKEQIEIKFYLQFYCFGFLCCLPSPNSCKTSALLFKLTRYSIHSFSPKFGFSIIHSSCKSWARVSHGPAGYPTCFRTSLPCHMSDWHLSFLTGRYRRILTLMRCLRACTSCKFFSSTTEINFS